MNMGGCEGVVCCGLGRVVIFACTLTVTGRLAQLKVGCIFILTQPIPSRLWLRYYTAFLLIFLSDFLCDLILILAIAASN